MYTVVPVLFCGLGLCLVSQLSNLIISMKHPLLLANVFRFLPFVLNMMYFVLLTLAIVFALKRQCHEILNQLYMVFSSMLTACNRLTVSVLEGHKCTVTLKQNKSLVYSTVIVLVTSVDYRPIKLNRGT